MCAADPSNSQSSRLCVGGRASGLSSSALKNFSMAYMLCNVLCEKFLMLYLLGRRWGLCVHLAFWSSQIAQGSPLLISLLIHFFPLLIQKCRIAEVGRHLWKSSWTNLCPQQSPTGPLLVRCWIPPKAETSKPPVGYLYTQIRSPWAFSSPHWTAPTLSAFPLIVSRGANQLLSSFAAFFPGIITSLLLLFLVRFRQWIPVPCSGLFPIKSWLWVPGVRPGTACGAGS